MTADFYKGVSKTMEDRMKDPRCLLDADALASHVSIVSLSETTPVDGTQTGTTKRRGKKKAGVSRKSGGTSKADGSTTNLNASATESKTSAMSGTSMSQTGTGVVGSSTGEWASQKVEFVKTEVPETMNKAFRIIERLLTQNQCHE
jgi:hypothetical protein